MNSTKSMTHDAVLWENLRWTEIPEVLRAVNGFVILPIGATEQHGPHLPLGVDSMTAQAVAHAASQTTRIPVLPEFKYGCSYGHSTKWPGTLSFSPSTLTKAVGDVVYWLVYSGVTRLAILNGHVGNLAPLKCAVDNLRLTNPDFRVRIISLWDVSSEAYEFYHADADDFHANCAETSLMMSLYPDMVEMSAAVDEVDKTESCFFTYAMNKQSDYGVVGKPTEATKEIGDKYFKIVVSNLAEKLTKAINEEV